MIPRSLKKTKKRSRKFSGFAPSPACNTGVKVTTQELEEKFLYYPKPVLEQMGCADPVNRERVFFTAPRPSHPNGELGVDWVTVTCRDFTKLQDVRYDLETRFFGVEFQETGKKLNLYTNCLQNEFGVLILYSKEGERNGWHFTVQVPGKALRLLTQQSLFELLRYFYVKGFTSSRIDVYLDVFQLPEGFETTNNFLREMKRCLQTETVHGKVVTGIRTWDDPTKNNVGESRVTGLLLGSRKSSFYMRIYDKAIEQGIDKQLKNIHLIKCPTWLRFETELKEELAQEAFLNLTLGVNDESEVQFNALKFVALGTINRVQFWDRKSRNLDRCQLLPWWQEITQSVPKFKCSTARPEPTINKAVAWFYKQISPWIAAVALAVEGQDGKAFDDLIKDLVADGIGRLKDRHLLALNEHLFLTETVNL